MKRSKCLVVMMQVFLSIVSVNAQEESTVMVSDSLYLSIKDLPEVQITAIKPLIKTEVDKTVYNVEDDPDSKTNTVIEMLRKIPSVSVDGEDQIRVNGSPSFKIYMNGKPSNMLSNNPAAILRSIPASTIKKIEVITDPGARYDAEGVSGILNIITKKGTGLDGYNVNLNSLLMKNQKLASLYGTFAYGKFSLSGGYSYSLYSMKSEEESIRHQTDNPKETYLYENTDLKMHSPIHYGGIESSYEIDSLNLISISASWDISKNSTNIYHSLFRMEDAGQMPVYSYTQDRKNKGGYGSSAFKADYQHLFKNKKDEIITLSYQYDYAPNDRIYSSRLSNLEGTSPSLQYLNNYDLQTNKASRNEHTVQLDYVNPFTSIHSLETGLKYIRRNNRSKATSEMKDSEMDAWSPSVFQPTLDYLHIQDILGIYAGYKMTKGRWGINAGLRLEQTWQQVEYKQGNGVDFDYKQTDWIPSYATFFKINDANQLRFTYNLRLRRPGIELLNPYVLISGTSISYGNPSLRTVKNHRLSIVHNYSSARLNLQLTALLALNPNVIANYQFVDSEGVLNSTYGAIEKSKGGGLSAYLGFNPNPNTSLSLNGMLNYLSIITKEQVPNSLHGWHNEGFCGQLYGTFSQRFKQGWRVIAGGGYIRPELTLGSDSYTYYFYGINVEKFFLNDKLTVMLRLQNFLNPSTTVTYRSHYPDVETVMKDKRKDRDFGITVSYRFGDLKAKVKKVQRSIANDDLENSAK